MFCKKCGMALEENAKFCTRCGEEVSQVTDTGEREFTRKKGTLGWKICVLGLLGISIIAISGIFLTGFFGKKDKEDNAKYIEEKSEKTLESHEEIAKDEPAGREKVEVGKDENKAKENNIEKEAEEKKEKEKKTKEEEMALQQQIEDAIDTYEQYIEEHLYGGELRSCGLFFLNNDRIPECIYDTSESILYSEVLTYKDGKVESTSVKFGGYQKEKGILVDLQGSMQKGMMMITLKEDGTFEVTEIGEMYIGDQQIGEKYTIDGKEIGKTEFWNRMDSYGKFTLIDAQVYSSVREAYENMQEDHTSEEKFLSEIFTSYSVETTYTAGERNKDFILEKSSTAYLSESDLAGLTQEELRIARNEIYARHGYHFTTDEMKAYFESQSWYVPSATEWSEDMLNEYEIANRDLIVAYEEKVLSNGGNALVDLGEKNSEEWKQLYLSAIEDMHTFETTYAHGKFYMIYVDNDNIPELLIEIPGYFYLLGIKNGEVQDLVCTDGFSYIEKTGLILAEDGKQHLYEDEIWKLEDGKVKSIAKGKYGAYDVGDMSYGEITEAHYTYYWNEEKLSKSQYEEKLKSAFDFSKGKQIDFYTPAMTYEELLASYGNLSSDGS